MLVMGATMQNLYSIKYVKKNFSDYCVNLKIFTPFPHKTRNIWGYYAPAST